MPGDKSPDAIWLFDGDIGSGPLAVRPSFATKSIDYKYNNYYFYAKVTTTQGGAQDNQKNDAKDFLRQAGEYVQKHNDDKIFVALVDGSYYQQNPKKLQQLKSLEQEKVMVLNTNELIEHFKTEFPLG